MNATNGSDHIGPQCSALCAIVDDISAFLDEALTFCDDPEMFDLAAGVAMVEAMAAARGGVVWSCEILEKAICTETCWK